MKNHMYNYRRCHQLTLIDLQFVLLLVRNYPMLVVVRIFKWNLSEKKFFFWGGGERTLTPLIFWPILADCFITPRNMFIWTFFLWNNSIFFLNVKTGSKMEFSPPKYPFLPLFGKNVLDLFFLPILSDFFIRLGNMFIWAIYLRNNSIFWKKCKNEFNNRVLLPPPIIEKNIVFFFLKKYFFCSSIIEFCSFFLQF